VWWCIAIAAVDVAGGVPAVTKTLMMSKLERNIISSCDYC
jgi:hypothetical protein